jgi:hypothetical protein
MKTLFKSSAIIAVASLALFTACNKEDSSSVAQNKIWLAHTVDYDANTGITTASAQFRFSNAVGTLLRLDDPANLKINNEDAEYVDAFAWYAKTYTGVKDSATFTYTDHDANTFNNTVLVGRAIDLPSGTITVSKTAAYDVVFQGQPVATGESVSVYIKEDNGTDWQMFTTISAGATKVTMTTDKLALLNTGGGKLKIERVKFGEPANNPGKGGLTTSKYSSQVKQITIVN